jgi:hypothetical protein
LERLLDRGTIDINGLIPRTRGQPSFIQTDGPPRYNDLRIPRAEVYREWPHKETLERDQKRREVAKRNAPQHRHRR